MMLRTPAGKRRRDMAAEAAMSPPAEAAVALVQCDPLTVQDLGFCGPYVDEEADRDEILDWDSMRCSYKCRNMVKSELLDNLALREKQVVEYEAAFASMKKKLAATEIDNQRLVSRVKRLEQDVVASNARERSLHSQRAEEVQQSEERFRKQITRCNELQGKLQTEIKLKSEAEAKARAAESQLLSLKDEVKSLRESSGREIQRLEVESQRVQEDNEFCISKINAESIADRQETENVSEDLAELRMQYSELQEKLNEVISEKKQAERELATATSKLSNSRIIESHEAETIIKSLREELNYHVKEIAEAKKLKEYNVKLEVLEEQLQMEKKRADRAEAEVADRVDMKFRISALEGELKAWEDMMSPVPGNLSRDNLPEKICELQREALVTLSENGELKAKVNELKSALEKALIEKQEAHSAAAAARQEAEDTHGKVLRLERQIQCLTRERDGLNTILSSYDEEERLLSQQKEPSSPFATPEKSKQKRIQELEDLLAISQQTVKRLERELETNLEAARLTEKRIELLTSDLSKAHSRISSLERESSELLVEIARLEGKVARGEFDPSKTKVLKLRTDLEAKETFSSPLQSALQDDTHEHIALMLESKQKISMLTDKVASLEREISTLKKRENRYMQVFAEKAFTFRTACGLIFGYEILMNEKPDSAVTFFKLRSIYSRDKENETLEFQYTANGHAVGRIDMLANDYTTSPEIERQVVTFLQGFKSIPAFMANLTLELFNKGTIG